MIERFIVKHIDKVYSTKFDTYTCEDVAQDFPML